MIKYFSKNFSLMEKIILNLLTVKYLFRNLK